MADDVFGVADDQPDGNVFARDRILVIARDIAARTGRFLHLLFDRQVGAMPIADVHWHVLEQCFEFFGSHVRALKASGHPGLGHGKSDQSQHAENQ